MATKLKEVDVVIVGLGWTGGILAKELAEAGLKVVALERGAMRNPASDYAVPNIRDELRYVVRHDLMQNTARDTITVRNSPSQEALPMRRLGSFLPGEVVGQRALRRQRVFDGRQLFDFLRLPRPVPLIEVLAEEVLVIGVVPRFFFLLFFRLLGRGRLLGDFGLGGNLLEHRVLDHLLVQELGELDRRHRQQFDRLLQRGRQNQLLR